MKILQINNFHYRRGGSEAVYLGTSELLRAHGHEVFNFSQLDPLNEPSEEENYFVNYHDFLNRGFLSQMSSFSRFIYSPESARKLEQLLQDKRPQVAHLHNIYGGLTSSILGVLKKHSIPVVITLHDYKLLCPVYTFLDDQNNLCEKCIKGNYSHCVIKRCNKGNLAYSIVMALESFSRDIFYSPAKYFDKIICVSRFALEKHSVREGLRGKMTHVYNFSAALENEPLRTENEGYYLYFGRLSREKGLSTLLAAFKDRKNFKLKIAGKGPLRAEVINAAQTVENIEFLGYKSGQELHGLIRKAAFVIIPSEWYENNPMVIIESYLLGTPVIGADIGGIPEVLVDDKTGFLFSSGNKESLCQAIDKGGQVTPSGYQKLSAFCHDFAVRNFNSAVHYQKIISVYNELILGASQRFQ